MTHKNNFKRGVLRGGSALSALAMLGAGLTSSMIMAAPAAAQDYTSGAISGTVTDDTGNPVAGATVTLTSAETGVQRTATTGAAGTFRFTGLTAASYDVAVAAPGRPNYRATGIRVLASQTADIPVQLAAAGEQEIVVVGAAIADFTGTTTGLNVDVAELTRTTPIARDLTSVVLLAPGTAQADDGFGNLASIGGSSVAENAYYINGLNITNFDNYLGSGRVPFEFYRSVEVKSGGYPAEFGRATGGIINTVSKSGSNEFFGAIHLNWIPNWLRSPGKNLDTIDADGVVTQTTNRDFDTAESYSAILEAGGPIIRDRLFLYGLVEFRRERSVTSAPASGLALDRRNDDPFYAIKVDAYPLDNHHFEFTLFDTRNTTRRSDLAYSEIDGVGSTGAASGIQDFKFGGVNYVAQYTGTLTDWLTVSGAYGRNRDTFETIGVDEGSSGFYFANASGVPVNGVANGGLLTGQASASREFPYKTEREFFRGDVDLFFDMFGGHHVRAGFDVENNSLIHTTVRTGGDPLLAAGFITQEAYDAGAGGAGIALIARAGNVVELNYYNNGGAFDAQNKAFYIQDEWKVTDRLTLNLGLRRDDFELKKPDGSKYIELKENYAPRIGFTYDLFADKRGKVYGFYGQYFLPVASNTAYRQAAQEFFFRERFNYSGIDANGLPILGSQVTNLTTYQAACPFALTPQSSGQNCSVTGQGTVKATETTLSQELKATRQTEYIIGYEHRLGEFTLGINYTHRNLDISAEDVAVDAAILEYCEQEGIEGCEDTWTGFHQYVVLNPGRSATFALDGLDGREVTLSAETLRYPKPKRTYDAVEFTFNKRWNGDYSLGGSYTWSESKGNSEGFVQSDFEQDDAGITQDFDQVGFTEFAEGLLPNHRRHRFRVFGAVALSEKFTLGGNIRVDSPRPLSCFGYNPNPNYFDPDGDPYSDFGNVYGAASHYCGTGEVDENGAKQSAPAPRGEGLRTSWISTIDISGRYNLTIGDRRVTLRADVFNLLNARGVQGRDEEGDLDLFTPDDSDFPTGVLPNPDYGRATSYQQPRYVRLGLDIEF